MAVVGQTLGFGVTADQASLITQKVAVNQKVDKKEARDKGGKVVAVSYYNKTSEVKIEGLGKSTQAVGASISLSSPPSTPVGLVFAEEVDVEEGNEDFVKSTVNGMAYEGITT